jgi:hypothetical protein
MLILRRGSPATAFIIPGRTLPLTGRVNSAGSASPRSTDGDEEGCADGDIGPEANCARDLAAFAARKDADANANGPDGGQQPHVRERRTRNDREIARVRKDGASGPTREVIPATNAMRVVAGLAFMTNLIVPHCSTPIEQSNSRLIETGHVGTGPLMSRKRIAFVNSDE